MLDDLYQEIILEHCKTPKHKGNISSPDKSCELVNPLCGDHIKLEVNFDANQLQEIAFSGQGCSISQASASIMSSLCKGKSREEILKLCNSFKDLMRGGVLADSDQELLGDAMALEGVRKFSSRIKCALLAWEAIEQLLRDSDRMIT